MFTITSSNRTRSEWAAYVAPPVRDDNVIDQALLSEVPHVGVTDAIAAHVVVPSPFVHVAFVDECGAPVIDPAAHGLIACENR